MRYFQGVFRLVFLVLVLSATGCSWMSGVRALSQEELNFYNGLKSQLELKSDQGRDELVKMLNENFRAVEETARWEIVRHNERIQMAKTIYSVNEVLTAPDSDSKDYIQATRNKVILYHLAEYSNAFHELIAAQMKQSDVRRKSILAAYDQVRKMTGETIASQQLIHNYLNKKPTGQLIDILGEVERQLTAFNEKIKEGDQENPVIKQLTDLGDKAQDAVSQSRDGLTEMIDVWKDLNK